METKQIDDNDKNNIYKCEFCDYNTSKIFLLKQHFKSKKHLKNMNMETDGNQNMLWFKCDICNKLYTNRSGLWKHKKKCIKTEESILQNTKNNEIINNNETSFSKDSIVEYIKQNNEIKDLLLKENEELKTQLKEQNKQIMELIPKVGSTSTTINNNKLSINVFLNEKCKDAMSINEFVHNIEISLKNLLTTKSKGIGIGINEIISENMNKLSVYERPIHCTDKKRETLYIKNDTWEKDVDKTHTTNMLKALQSQQFKAMKKWLAEHPNYDKDDDLKHEYMILVNKCSSSLNDHEKKLFKNICESTYLKDDNLLNS